MTKYVATVNVPGYLPMSDESAVFDSAAEAWLYLRDERIRDEDYAPDFDGYEDYSATVDELDGWALEPALGTVYGDTPGSESDHDLGLAYSVTVAEDVTL